MLVSFVESMGTRWSEGVDPDEATQAWGAGLLVGAGGEREPVASVSDLDADGVPVRVYRPESESRLALVVFFHGGGFTIGSVDSHDPITRRLANRVPAVVMSVGYRTGPAHRFPAAHDDAWTALRWAASHADALGADPARVAAAGDSSGAGLATYLAIRSRDENGPALRLQMLWLPWIDCNFDQASFEEFGDGFVLDADAMHWFRDSYVGPADYVDWRVSPARTRDLTGLAPAFVATAECDPLRDQGEEFAQRLRAADVDVAGGRYDGTYHPFYGMTAMLEAARRLEHDTVSALREALA